MRTDKERSDRNLERYERLAKEDAKKVGNYIPPANMHLGIFAWIAFFALLGCLILKG